MHDSAVVVHKAGCPALFYFFWRSCVFWYFELSADKLQSAGITHAQMLARTLRLLLMLLMLMQMSMLMLLRGVREWREAQADDGNQ